MIRYSLVFAFIVMSGVFCIAQEYDQSYFTSPVKHKMRLSGSFAELRTNHFHMGIDIKSTNGRSGDEILAVADGIISRINVDASGYGNALYIDHNNGYTTVYAHLSSFSEEISEYVKSEQYRTESFQQQLYPDSMFIVKQGEVIGNMGNTGKSFGPHLHFEIRETKTETPINPFLWGLKPSDNKHPVFQNIRFYESDSIGNTNLLAEQKVTFKSEGKYKLNQNQITLAANQIAISVQVYDQMDGAYNKNGVYLMKMLVDDKVVHGYKLDKVSYEEGHYINSFIDFGEKQKSKRQFSNCFTHPGDSLSIYEHKAGRNGHIKLEKDKYRDVTIVLQDYHGNESELSFKVTSANSTISQNEIRGNYSLSYNERNIVRLKNADIIFKGGSFVTDKLLNIKARHETTDGYQLPTFEIGEKEIPLFKSYKLYLQNLAIPDTLKDHFCLVQCRDKNQVAHKGDWQDSLLMLRLNNLGAYQSSLDLTPPLIEPINLKYDMSREPVIKFKITDNLKPASKKDRLAYRGNIDGKWILFEYDLKNDLIFYKFDENFPKGEHKLTLSVNDNRGNESSFSQQIKKF